MVETLRPRTLPEALSFLKEKKAMPLAGGTDLMVHYRNYTGTGSRIDRPVLFTDAIEELRQIKMNPGSLEIGAAVLLSELERHKDVPELLRLAVSEIASPALRNRATLAGNICNASPAGDSLPPLYVYDAEFVLHGSFGQRIVSVHDFIRGPGQTVLAENELLTAVRIPLEDPLQPPRLFYYRKIGTRAANALSKLSLAADALVTDGRITDFRAALGAVAPTVVRNRNCESLVIGKKQNQIDIEGVLKSYEALIRPIDDQRSTAVYRKEVALNLIKDFLETLTA